jgi:hypothetical protein
MAAPTDDEIADAIRQAAVDPAAASVDGQSATAQDPLKLMKIQDRVVGNAAAAQRRRGVTYSQLIPHGAAPDCGSTSDFNSLGCR